ncbi:MAG: tetratricopeptide repeat protein [Melioribacteraceae bacterium]|nr:tetratricopeptide repeat protein [Melioribacteraceae bacterium]MCF8354440.1 tetratricopeptide repeat protein [Melioribacteraceae bacterium]MCF8394050.1 tetratricopeptide repeat protein [Melioribacteraceae bacterium]MCF8419816.1 tetratricopeptide repeat protein [Melioribacteraceae bacterium]
MKNFVYILILISFGFISGQIDQLDQEKLKLAQKYEQAGQLEKAEEIYSGLLQKYPWNQQYIDNLNKVYLAQKNYQASIELLKRRLNNSPQDLNTYGLLGSTYYIMNKEDDAFRVWDEAIEKSKSQSVAYRVIANYAIRNRAFDKATDILEKGKENAKDPKMFSYDLANIYSITMNYKNAAEEYCEVILDDPKQFNSVIARMNNYLNSAGAVDESVDAIKSYVDEYEDNPELLNLLVNVYQSGGLYNEAFESVKKLDTKTENNGARIFSFAQSAFNDGEFTTAVEAFKLVIEKYTEAPFYSYARIKYVRTVEELLNRSESKERWKPISIPGVGSDRYKDILQTYNELAVDFSGTEISKEAVYRMGVIHYQKYFNIAEAESLFTEVISNKPPTQFDNHALINLAEISIVQGDLNKAEEYYQRVFSAPQNLNDIRNAAVYGMGKIDFWKGNFEGALKMLGGLTNKLQDDFANDALELAVMINIFRKDSINLSAFAKADFMASRYQLETASKMFESISLNESLMVLNDLAKYENAKLLIASNQYTKAEAVLREIIESEKPNLKSDDSYFLLAKLYRYGLSDNVNAVKIYEKLLEKFPASLYLSQSRQALKELENNQSETI